MSSESESKLDNALRTAEALDPDDRMRLIARLWAALPEDYWAAPDALERTRIDTMVARGDTQGLFELPRQIARKLLSPAATPPKSKIYSAPRRFDLATIFVVTFAYSLLFGLMSYFHFPPAVSLIIGGFITLVGVGQALLFGGQNARVASVITGVVLSVLFQFCMVIWPPRGFSGFAMIFMLPIVAAVGAGFGYMAGALVGGVFLVADYLRTYFTHPAPDVDEVELEEIDADRESQVTT